MSLPFCTFLTAYLRCIQCHIVDIVDMTLDAPNISQKFAERKARLVIEVCGVMCHSHAYHKSVSYCATPLFVFRPSSADGAKRAGISHFKTFWPNDPTDSGRPSDRGRSARPESILPSIARLIGARLDDDIEL